MIEFKCEFCRADMEAPQSLAGQSEECPKCGLPNIVPVRPGADAPGATSQTEPSVKPGELNPLGGTRGARKRLQGIMLVAGLLLVGLVCLFPPVVSLDGESSGQSAGRRFLFATEFSGAQIDHAAFQSWKQTKEGIALDAQMSQAEKVREQADAAFNKANAAAFAAVGASERAAFDKADAANHAAYDAASVALDNYSKAFNAYNSARSAAEDKALEQAIASRWPFSGIIRARDYGRAFLECIGIVVLTAIGFLFVRFRQRRHERDSV